MRIGSALTILILIACVFCGCNRDPLSEIVYARIEGIPLTAADVRDAVETRLRLGELRSGKPVPTENLDNRRNGMAAQIIPQLISARVMMLYLDKENVQATRESDAQTLEKYNRILKTKYTTVDELAEQFKDFKKAFRQQFANESRILAYDIAQGFCIVTDEDKANYYTSTSNRIRRASLITKQAHVKAAAALKRLKSGESWDVVAQEVSEDRLLDEEWKDFWKKWDQIPETSYPYPEVITALAGLKENDYTQPFESEMGLLIVKVNKIDDDGTRECSRILFRMGKEISFVPEDKLDGFLRARKIEDGHRALLTEFGETVKLEFPQGEHFDVKIWPLAGGGKNEE